MSLSSFLQAEKLKLEAFEAKIEVDLKGAGTIIENEILPFAIGLGNGLKLITTADSSDYIGAIFGKAGIAIEDETRTIVTNGLPKLQFAQTLKGQTLEEIITAVVPVLEGETSDPKTKMVIDFVAQVTQDFAANKGISLTVAQAIQLSQLYYTDKQQLAAESASQTATASENTTAAAAATDQQA